MYKRQGLCLSGVSAQRDWAQFAKYEAANRRIDYPVKAVFMGNSITDNWALMDSVFFAEHRFVGRGISGQTSAEMLVRFRQDVIGLSPEAVVIMAGTNDLAQNNGYIALENILGNIASMCELAKLCLLYTSIGDQRLGGPALTALVSNGTPEAETAIAQAIVAGTGDKNALAQAAGCLLYTSRCV